jgi:hypothetical protein
MIAARSIALALAALGVGCGGAVPVPRLLAEGKLHAACVANRYEVSTVVRDAAGEALLRDRLRAGTEIRLAVRALSPGEVATLLGPGKRVADGRALVAVRVEATRLPGESATIDAWLGAKSLAPRDALAAIVASDARVDPAPLPAWLAASTAPARDRALRGRACAGQLLPGEACTALAVVDTTKAGDEIELSIAHLLVSDPDTCTSEDRVHVPLPAGASYAARVDALTPGGPRRVAEIGAPHADGR